MKKFSFKMDPLLRLRAYDEKIKFASYARVLGEYNKNNTQAIGTDQTRAAVLQNASKKMRAGEFDLRSMQYLGDYLNHLEKKKRVALYKNSELQSELEEKRAIAQDARKKRKVLEILKEKKHEEYLYEFAHEEGKTLDEFNQKSQWRKQNDEKHGNL